MTNYTVIVQYTEHRENERQESGRTVAIYLAKRIRRRYIQILNIGTLCICKCMDKILNINVYIFEYKTYTKLEFV
jgi:hypothetical protein